MELTGRTNSTGIFSDRIRIWLLVSLIIISGASSGLALINTLMLLGMMIGLILAIVRYGWRYAVLAACLALVVSFLFYGPIVAAGTFFLFILPGILMGHKARAFGTPLQIILRGMLVYVFPLLLLIIFYPQIISRTEMLVNEFMEQLDAASILPIQGNAEQQAMISSVRDALVLMLKLSPGIFITTFAAFAIFAYLGAKVVAPYFGAILPAMTPFSFWRGSDLWLVPLGVALLLILVGGEMPRLAGLNLAFFMIHVYALFGFAIVEYFLGKSLAIGWPRHLLYILMLAVAIIFIPALAFLGLLDSRFDFRKLGEEKA